jgi:hypothetical protein
MQMEPETETSLWQHYLSRKPELKEKFISLTTKKIDRSHNLRTNLLYQVAIARLKYWPDPDPLPAYNDVDGMCMYYIRIYNGGGAATLKRTRDIYKYRVLDL